MGFIPHLLSVRKGIGFIVNFERVPQDAFDPTRFLSYIHAGIGHS